MYICRMKVKELNIPGLLEITPDVFEDDRGYFYETYNKGNFIKLGVHFDFSQDNQSLSHKGVLRGLHFQAPPFEQGKLVRVVTGAVLDIAVDIRSGSPTYGQYHAVELTEENKKMFWIPPGFAHGFKVLRDHTVFSYKCTSVYDRQSEGSVLWNDPELKINWGDVSGVILSEKDRMAPLFSQLNSPFSYSE